MGPIESLLTDDHAELAKLLDSADREETIDTVAYEAFRRRLLRHIALEEKVLLPAARAIREQPLDVAKQLRVDHGKIAKLLVPSPTHEICRELREILERHNAVEEGPGGLYATCDELLKETIDTILRELRDYPEVPTAKHYDGPLLKRQ